MHSPTLFRAALAIPMLASFARCGTLTLSAANDTTIYAESGTLANGAGDFLFAGQNNVGQPRRALVRFDVASALPQGSTIVSAQLSLTVSQTISGPQPVRIHRLLADWSEGPTDAPGSEGAGGVALPGDATWTARSLGQSLWTTLGGDFAPVASAEASVDQLTTHTWGPTFSMADDVQLWLDDPTQNAGWILIGAEGSNGSSKRFDSRTNPSGAGPTLTIDFNPPCTPASYCTALSNSTGAAAHLTSTSPPIITLGQFGLSASGLPPSAATTFYFGQVRGEEPFLNGNRCVLGHIYRAGTVLASAGGIATRTIDLAILPGQQISTYSTWCFQAFYRDPAAGGPGMNYTDALAATFCP